MLGALLAAPAAAPAALLKNAVIAKTANNDVDESHTNPNFNWESVASPAAQPTLTTLEYFYSSVLAIDAGVGGPAVTESRTSEFTLTFDVDALTGETWQIVVDVRRVGLLELVHESGALGASAEIGALTGSAGGVSLVSGGLGLPGHGPLAGTEGGTLGFDDSTSATFEATGPATVVLTFTWDQEVATMVNLAGSDEACVHLGRSGVSDPIDCDDPGQGGAGVFVDVELLNPPGLGFVTTNGSVDDPGRVLFEVFHPGNGRLIDCAEYASFLLDDGLVTSMELEDALNLAPAGPLVTRIDDDTIRLAWPGSFGARVCAVPGTTNCGPAGSLGQCPFDSFLGFQTVRGVSYSGMGMSSDPHFEASGPGYHVEGGLFAVATAPGVGPIGGIGTQPPIGLAVPPLRFGLSGGGGLVPFPGNPGIAQLETAFSLTQPSQQHLYAGGGPGSFSFCPGHTKNPSCTLPSPTPGGRVGRVRYQAGPNQFGGTMRMVQHMARRLSLAVATSPPIYAHHSGMGTVVLPGGGAYAQTSTFPLLTGSLTMSPVLGPSGSIVTPGIPIGTAPPPSPTRLTGFGFTTGRVTVSGTSGGSPVVVTLTGSDARTPGGLGSISLVAGGLVHSTAGSLPRTSTLTMTIPEPRVVAAQLAGAAALGLLYRIRRRRQRR